MSSVRGFSIVCTTPNVVWIFDKKQLKKVFRQGGAEIATVAKAMLRGGGGGGGRYYRYNGGVYQASAPGSPPARRSGALIRSMKVDAFRSGTGASIKAREFYALFLEMGAKGGGKGKASRNKKARWSLSRSRTVVTTKRVLEPRPFLAAARAARWPSLVPRIKAAIDDGIAFKKKK